MDAGDDPRVRGRAAREGDDERTIRERHLAYFLALVESAYEERIASESTWLPIVGAEHDNIRAALDWAATSRPDAEAQLAGAISYYWHSGGRVAEAREGLVGVLARYEPRDGIRARVLTLLAGFDGVEEAEAFSYLDQALSLWRELDDAAGEALALEELGWTSNKFGAYEAAKPAFEQSLALRRQAGTPELDLWQTLAGLCLVLVSSGEIERAEPVARELQALGARHEARRTEQLALHFLADCPLVGGDYLEAERRYLRALAYARTSGLPRQCVNELHGVAMSAAGQGECARAVRLAAAADAEKEAMGMEGVRWWNTMQERLIGGARAQLSDKEREAAERAGKAASFDAMLDEVLGTETAPAGS
jgi:tetratricopeptide (TPR) repeat protein